METFYVNNIPVTPAKDKTLLRYLRDELHITSAKDGCSQGACGTCTVLIDGKTVRACTVRTSALGGKHVLTVEGLSDYEKQVFTYAFGEAGAVQCGFCIPGMVMCAKGLLDVTPTPTEAEVRHAIRFNICRCTGYVKIVKAILLAAEILRAGTAPRDGHGWGVGERVHRIDVKEKVLGAGEYCDDISMKGMIHASAVRSQYPRAKILSIDTAAAKALPGVVGVFTADDIPGDNKVGHIKKDWDTMIPVGGVTHYLGDAVCIVAAETEEILAAAKKLVKVAYEPLTPVRSPYEAMAEDAPKVHQTGNLLAHKHVSRGNAAQAIAQSKYVLTEKYTSPYTEHAFLEPECAVAFPDGDGVKVFTSDQSVYDTQREIVPMVGLLLEQVCVENKLVGGGFGGKEDVTVQHHAALVACLTGRPVKVKLSRAESLLIHPKRHPMDMTFTMGCDENGIIQGVKAEVIADTGAYASLGGPVLERACTHASGPYNYQNFEIDGYAYYTNNPPAGAFRGFGVTQTCFGVESLLTKMADTIGVSPWEIRYRNALRPGQEMPNGQFADASTGLAETLEAVKDVYESAKYAGIACAMKNAGVGVGLPDVGRVKLTVEGGKVHILAGASCIGQGVGTVLMQIVHEATGVGRALLVHEAPNSHRTPDSGTTSGSRQTLLTGEAARRAGALLREALAAHTLNELEGQSFYADYFPPTDVLGSDKPHPVSHVAYGYATQVAILNDQGRVERIVAAHEVGKAVNPLALEGQIEGGVIMSTGFALTERYPLKDCKPTAAYGSLGLFRAPDCPAVTPIIVEKAGVEGAYGAIGIGEITSIPTAPAIADAYYRFDGLRRTSLPLANTPYAYTKPLPSVLKNPGKKLTVNRNAACIGCLACMRACADAFFKMDDPAYSCLKIVEKKGELTPAVCVQCGKCAVACPTGAIKQNSKGVYVVNKKLCTGCGVCREACPLHVMVETPDGAATSKCIACGLCAAACPMDVLAIATGPEA